MASSPAPSDAPSATTLSPSPSDSSLSTPASPPPSGTPSKVKLKPEDFQFGGLLGEGSYAKVLYAKQKATGKEYAVKVVDKNFVQRLGKQDEMVNEKRVLSMLDHPCIIKLHYTFQDNYSLYFVLELANNGELFSAISKAGRLNQVMAQFYAAEMVAVLEYLHKTGIIHRDIKPENVLIAEDGHIKLTDFATSKILEAPAPVQLNPDGTPVKRKKSFVGTAEYVSPEQLNDKPVTTAADSWALGCVLYQMLVGKPPFRGESEYLTFQKVLSRDLSFPPFLSPEAKSLIEGLLTVDASARLGHNAADWERVKQHPFFEGIKWETLCSAPPPAMLLTELRKFSVLERAKSSNALNIDSDDDESVGASSIDLHQLEEKDIQTGNVSASESADLKKLNLDVWRKFLIDKEEIVFAGMVTKRRGFFAKKRQLILTTFPRFIYINPVNMELRGSIQWSRELWVEVKNEKVFYIHTPKRDYYMVAMDCAAQTWQKAIDRVRLESTNK